MTAPAPRFDAVCFDCDSTLSRVEGIDELAARTGVADEIAPLTAAAMDGTIPLDSVYGRRLEIVRPGRDAVRWLGERYVAEMTSGAVETVETLRRRSVTVYVVSGGVRGAILPLADTLGIPRDNVHAVEIAFDENGDYVDFDRASPLTRSDGKAAVCRELLQCHRTLALVGDGVTDVAAREGGAFVIGFGGVVAREAVREQADAFVEGPNLTALLTMLLEYWAPSHGNT